MATVTRGKTFNSGDTVYPADIHQLVDSATITFTTASDADDSTLEVSGNKFRVKDAGIVTAKIADANVTTAKLASTTQQGLLPAGAVMPFAMNSAPSGWLAADGSAVSRTTYAALFAAIGVTHGAGDSVTTFNLPDLRGIFVRGSGSQTISGTTYSGTFGTKQNDLLKNHTHNHTDWSPNSSLVGVMGASNNIWQASASNVTRTTTNPNASLGGDETRPANIALLYCIKF